MDHLNVTHVVGLALPDRGCGALLSGPALRSESDCPSGAAVGTQM